jgi:small subunit ribosomal protein S16
MLAIRMQRTGRKGHAMFRVVVQDARRTPTSGKVVARLGSYDPHAKTVTLDKEKASYYLEHGAQPSERVVVLLKKEGVKLPDWVQEPTKKEGAVRNADKRRSTRPPEESVEEAAAEEAVAPEAEPAAEAAPSEEKAEAEEATEAPAETAAEESADAPAEEEPVDAEPNSAEPTEEAADEKPAEAETEAEK